MPRGFETLVRLLCLATLGMAERAPAAEPPEAGSLTLPAAVTQVLLQHPARAAAVAERDAAGATVGEARAGYWPAVRATGSATEYQEPTLVVPLHGFSFLRPPAFDTTIFQGNLTAAYTVFDAGARGARVRHAEAERAAATAGVESAEQALVLQTIVTYLEVLTQHDILGAQDERLGALNAERRRVQQSLDAGRAARVEMLRVEAAVARAEADRVHTVAALAAASADLGRLLGSGDTVRPEALQAVALRDTMLPPRDVAARDAEAASPELARARAQLDGAAAGAALSRSARWPEFRAQAGATGWSDDAGHDALEWNAALSFSYPLFTGGAIARAVQRADARARGASAGADATALAVATDVDHALARASEARARVRSLAFAVERSTEVARIEQLLLTAGSGTQTDYLRAQADRLEARAELVEARNGEIAARAELARITGALDAAWIARTLEAGP